MVPRRQSSSRRATQGTWLTGREPVDTGLRWGLSVISVLPSVGNCLNARLSR